MRLRVGRLFGKFFLAFFLAQMLTVVGVGVLIWMAGPEPFLPEPEELWERAEHVRPGEAWEIFADVQHPPHRAVAAAREVRSAVPAEKALPGPAVSGVSSPYVLGTDSTSAELGATRQRDGRSSLAEPAAASDATPSRPAHQGLRLPRQWWRHPHRHGFPFLPVGVGILASALFAFLLARHFAGPILALRLAFAEVGRGNFKVRLGPAGSRHPDELESLRTEFDASTERLEVLVEGQRRLLHDVSHEVRSPVARLQLALDLIRQQPARAEDLLTRMERECGRIDHLMEELLTLSRIEARAFGTLDQWVDLAEVLHAVGEDAGFEGEARAVRVEVECPSHFVVRGHPELLHRAIENVVRNALSHGPEGSVVTLRGAAATGTVPLRIVIEDQGSGVAECDLERMFQPFKRLPTGARGEGHGLGLAITREAMAAHGGRVHAENRSDGGLRVVLEFC
jgi:signal transduction histidine kinase